MLVLSSMNRSRPVKARGAGSLGAWSDRKPTRPRVTRDQVVRHAIEVLDAEGFDRLTMRRLADRMGIRAASLYNHVRDKNELLALVGDALCERISELDPARPWRDRLETMALEFRRVLKAHRDGARVLAATPPLGPNRLRLVDQVLHALETAGFSAAETADASIVLNSFIVGFALDEVHGDTSDARSSRRARGDVRRWFKSLSRQQYPTLVRLADQLVEAPTERRFELGLRALLDGLERRLPKRR